MKKIAVAVCCLLTICTSAQKFSFKLGSEYELPKKTEDLSFFGNEKDGLINLALKDDELHIIRFNAKTLAESQNAKIDLKDLTKNFNSEQAIDFGDKVYWLHSDWDKGTEKEILYYDVIDIKNGQLTNHNTKMLEADKMAGDAINRGFYSYKKVNKFDFNFDARRTKLLVSYRLQPESRNDKKNYDRIGLYVFDDKMKKVWSREFTMPYTEAIMDNSDFTIDGNGNAYLLAKVYDSEARKERDKATGKPAYHYEVMKFTPGKPTPLISVVSVGDNFLNKASIIENALGELIVAGSYSKSSSASLTAGIFLAAIDSSGKVAKYRNGFYQFPKEELEKFERASVKRKMEKKDDYESRFLAVRNITADVDGSVLIACEESYYRVHTSTVNGRTTTTYVHFNEDIIAAKINPSGNFDWVRKIPKRQKGSVPIGTMSFKLINDAGNYYFLYLDNINNLHLPEDAEPKYHLDGAGGQVMVTKIDAAGVVSKTLVFDTREEDVMIYPTGFNRFNNNQFIGRARIKKKLYQPVLITMK